MNAQSTGPAPSVCFEGMSVSSKSSRDRGLSSLLGTLRRALASARGIAGVGAGLLLLASFGFADQPVPPSLTAGWYQESPAANPGGILHDILWLKVAMNDPNAMRGIQRLTHLLNHLDPFLRSKLRF